MTETVSQRKKNPCDRECAQSLTFANGSDGDTYHLLANIY